MPGPTGQDKGTKTTYEVRSNQAPGDPPRLPDAVGAAMRVRLSNLPLLLTVIIPTLLAILYYGLIASDIYVSESHFVVRGPQRQGPSGIGALLQGATGGFSRSVEDSFSVTDFITSRDALRQLEDELHVKQAFGSDQVDRLSRFAGIDPDDSFEALHRYYREHVTVSADAAVPISVLTVRAFSSDTAFSVNERLLELSEQLVNALNERARQDMIRFAESVVHDAEARSRSAAIAVSDYRHRQRVFDPEKQSAVQLAQISSLQGDLSATKARLAQIRTLAKNNPQIPALERMVAATQSEIDAETERVAGGQASLANKAVEYEGLVLEQLLAERQLETALASLVQARDEAQRKQLYLERIVQPNRPDTAVEPRRLRSVVATLLLGLVAWGILSLLTAGMREHHD
jgi:capsular polysaccharide transport system permease protein